MDTGMQDGVAVPAVVGLVNRIKARLPDDQKKWLPLVALLLGIAYAFLYSAGKSVQETLAKGMTIGLAASGAFDGVRALFRKNGQPGDTTVRLRALDSSPPTG